MDTINSPGPPKTKGFTLVELMIVTLVVAILAAIAYPIYTSQIRKAKRAEAKSKLTKAVNRAEQFYSQVHHYPQHLASISMNKTTSNKAYQLKIIKATDSKFEVKATAKGNQNNGECTSYELWADGKKKSNGTKKDPHNCW